MFEDEEELAARIYEHEVNWCSAPIQVQDEALHRLDVDSIYDYTMVFDLEDEEYLWRDALSVLNHVGNEMGITWN